MLPVVFASLADDPWFPLVTGLGGFLLGALGVGLTWWYQRVNDKHRQEDARTRLELGAVEGSTDEAFWHVRIGLSNRSRHTVVLLSAAIDTAPQRQGDLKFVRLAHSTAGWGPVWEEESPRATLEPGAQAWVQGRVGRRALVDDETTELTVIASTGETFSWQIALDPGTREHWP